MRNRALVLAALVAATVATSASPASAESRPAGPTPTTKTCTITGTSKADNIRGTAGDDVICGLGGNDTIRGLGGNDTIYGGGGADKISGGSGADSIWGGAGNDKLSGNNQNDYLSGDAGSDTLSGGSGSDMLLGGSGKDRIASSVADTCTQDSRDTMMGKCKIDTGAPGIASTSREVLTFSAGTSATFSWQASDPSGVDQTWLTIGGPAGWITDWCGFVITAELTSGTAQDGTYSATCTIPQNVPNQNYRAFVNARDSMGNITTSETGIDFAVVGGTDDTTAPTFEYLTGADLVTPGGTFTLTWRATDESAVVYSSAYFSLTDGGFSDGYIEYISAVDSATVISGTDKDRVYQQTFAVNPGSPAGEYILWSVGADNAGNKALNQTPVKILVVTR